MSEKNSCAQSTYYYVFNYYVYTRCVHGSITTNEKMRVII